MPTRSPIILLHGTTREEVPATFIEDVTVDELKNADREWQADLQPYLEQLSGLTRRSGEDWRTFSRRAYRGALALQVAPERLPEHPHWEWAGKQRRAGAESRIFGIECEGQAQALMLARSDKLARLPVAQGQPLAYIDYLASAPWNLPNLTASPRFRGSGFVLVRAAIQWSLDQGWEGRLGLHALPGAEDFYRNPRKCGMFDLGIDPNYGKLRYFEFSAVQARAFLER